MAADDAPDPVLLVRAGGHTCALPLDSVIETFRPLPVRPLTGLPAAVLGAALVRGAPAPVLDLAALAGGVEELPSRWVTVSCGADRVAVLAVGAVLGVRPLPAAAASAGSPLLEGAARGAVAALRVRDGELVAVLDAARLVPEGAFDAVERAGRA